MFDDIMEILAKAISAALKAGVPGTIIRQLVDDEEKKLPSKDVEKLADAVFDQVIKERFPEDK